MSVRVLRSVWALFIVGLAMAPAAAADDAAAKPADTGKHIDLVLCLDTSNSMDGLITSAKAKLWDIVNNLATAKPTPQLRVALYSYGNNGYNAQAGWVRKEADLTTDLDLISQRLFALTTNGGEEYVARVSRDALDQQPWCDARDGLKILFVCGNESAEQDPAVTLRDVADKARKLGVIVNTIHCGNAQEAGWREFAQMAGGKFMNIDQSGTINIETPHDKDLAALGAKLNATYVTFGQKGKDKQMNQLAQDANAAKVSGAVAAARAQTKATPNYRTDDWDLVDRLKRDPKFDVKKVPVAELCEELKKMKPEEREAHVKKKLAEREALQKQIAEVNAKREKYVREQLKKNASRGDRAFDEAVRGVLRDQAATKNIVIPE